MSLAALRPIRLFLDANVLVSAARKDGSKVLRVREIPGTVLLTSDYVLVEAKRNLSTKDQFDRLDTLLVPVQISRYSEIHGPPEFAELPEKDRPVLAGAILARADYLITGDRRHFGAWFGKTILGVRVELPASIVDLLMPA